jgi:AraC-like DNA-binding protein
MSAPGALLFVSSKRVLYRGPLGRPRERKLGAHAWYLPTSGLVRVSGSAGEVCVGAPGVRVAAGLPHQVEAESGHILCFLVEIECADAPAGHHQGVAAHGVDAEALASLRDLDAAWLKLRGGSPDGIDAELDRLILGRPLPSRPLEPRIADVVRRVRLDPALTWQAPDAAQHCGLSPSRFMHLFKAELGMGWRDFRAWTRARALLARVHTDDNLTQVALSLGYPDGTHFSHAIRQITGLRPRDIIEGSRNLSVWSESGVSPA